MSRWLGTWMQKRSFGCLTCKNRGSKEQEGGPGVAMSFCLVLFGWFSWETFGYFICDGRSFYHDQIKKYCLNFTESPHLSGIFFLNFIYLFILNFFWPFPVVHGTLVPWLGLNPHPRVGRQSLNHWATGEGVSGIFEGLKSVLKCACYSIDVFMSLLFPCLCLFLLEY